MAEISADGNLPTDQQIQRYCDLDARKARVEMLTRRLARLQALTEKQAPGDRVILELVNVEGELDEARAWVAKGDSEKESLDQLRKNYPAVRSDLLRLDHEIAQTQARLANLQVELNDLDAMLAMSGPLGATLTIIEPAKNATPVKVLSK